MSSGAALTLRDVMLLNGRSTSGSGGAVFVDSLAALTAERCVFAGCYAKLFGGAINAAAGALSVSVSASQFRSNQANSGGGDIASAAPTTLSECAFNSSWAPVGAQVYISNGCVNFFFL